MTTQPTKPAVRRNRTEMDAGTLETVTENEVKQISQAADIESPSNHSTVATNTGRKKPEPRQQWNELGKIHSIHPYGPREGGVGTS